VLTRCAANLSKVRWCVQIATLIVCLLHYCSQMLSLFLLSRKTMSIVRHTIRFLNHVCNKNKQNFRFDFLGSDTKFSCRWVLTILEEYVSSIFRVKLISVRMRSGNIGKMDEITQYWDGESPVWGNRQVQEYLSTCSCTENRYICTSPLGVLTS